MVRFGCSTTRALVRVAGEDGPHEVSVGFSPGVAKRLRVDGASVDRLIDEPSRPLLSVFLPDRLDLVKGPPALRRAHLDQVSAALWPARRQTRRAYSQALAQRNALIARIRVGRGSRGSLASWDEQLARCGIDLMRQRQQVVDSIAPAAARIGTALGLDSPLTVRYRPRSTASAVDELAAEFRERISQDLERGFTAHGPHRDELSLLLDGREVRAYASQGQQRVALLALLLAERETIAEQRQTPPVMLLDDVMSELDHYRREALVELLAGHTGQAILTATEFDQIPGAADAGMVHLAISPGTILEQVIA
jgi:DNA replication and repair protein RecF